MSFKICFNKFFFKNFNEIFFIENNNIDYYDNSHMNYIYTYKIDNIEYIFNGYYKDDYFVITIDSYDIELMVNIEIKYVILLKLNWKKIFFNEKNIFVVDIKNKEIYDTFIINIRKKMNSLINISLDDYLRFNNYEIIGSKVSLDDEENEKTEDEINKLNTKIKTSKFNIINKIKSFILDK